VTDNQVDGVQAAVKIGRPRVDPGKRRARQAEYRRRPEVAARQREHCRKANAKRRATPEGRLNHRLNAGIRWALLSTGSAGKGHHKWHSIVGYTVSDLRIHLEKQFKRGMSWDNIGEWHIDHIQPLSSFRFTSHEDPEFRAAWCLSNLRPLWKFDNLSKRNRRTVLL
jgi:hypothetical protein